MPSGREVFERSTPRCLRAEALSRPGRSRSTGRFTIGSYQDAAILRESSASVFLQVVKSGASSHRRRAVRIQTNDIFVQLFGMLDIVLAFLQLSRFQPLGRLIRAAGRQDEEQEQ